MKDYFHVSSLLNLVLPLILDETKKDRSGFGRNTDELYFVRPESMGCTCGND